MKNMVLAMLCGLMVCSALAVVYCKYQVRQLFIEMQIMEKKIDSYEIEWGKLQLELTTITGENQVEQMATDELKMKLPESNKIIYLKP